VVAWSRAGLHIAIDTSPSLRLTLLPPNAFNREDVGKLINENTERPALDTCAKMEFVNAQSKRSTMYLRIATIRQYKLKSGAKIHKKV
jgi:hypothetical protein